MKFTRKDLIEAMGLHVGDRIKTKNGSICEISFDGSLLINGRAYSPFSLIDEEFEIVPPIKNVGEQLCSKMDCDSGSCPLHSINCYLHSKDDPSLYDVLEAWHKKYKDDELYKILKTRLDKEIEQ